jgi:hypothetical protein
MGGSSLPIKGAPRNLSRQRNEFVASMALYMHMRTMPLMSQMVNKLNGSTLSLPHPVHARATQMESREAEKQRLAVAYEREMAHRRSLSPPPPQAPLWVGFPPLDVMVEEARQAVSAKPPPAPTQKAAAIAVASALWVEVVRTSTLQYHPRYALFRWGMYGQRHWSAFSKAAEGLNDQGQRHGGYHPAAQSPAS